MSGEEKIVNPANSPKQSNDDDYSLDAPQASQKQLEDSPDLGLQADRVGRIVSSQDPVISPTVIPKPFLSDEVDTNSQVTISAENKPQGIRSRWQNTQQAVPIKSGGSNSPAQNIGSGRRTLLMVALILILSLYLSFCALFNFDNGQVSKLVLITMVGNVAVSSGLTPLALQLFNSTVRETRGSENVLLNWANQRAAKDANAAEPLYQELIKAKPEFASGHLNHALNLVKLEKVSEAFAEYDRAISLNKTYALAYNNRGNLFVDYKKYDKAIADLSKAVEYNGQLGNPMYAFIWANRAYCYMDMKQWKEADDDLDDAIEHGFKDPRAYSDKGFCLQNLKKFSEAVDNYKIFLAAFPNNKDALLGRAYCYEQLGDKRAAEDRRRASALPDN